MQTSLAPSISHERPTDIAAYDSVYQRLIEKVSLSDVTSSFAMEQIKYTTALPLTYAE